MSSDMVYLFREPPPPPASPFTPRHMYTDIYILHKDIDFYIDLLIYLLSLDYPVKDSSFQGSTVSIPR